jgi:hypothetical protein
MSRSYVGKALREQVAREARYRCGYCLTSARVTGTRMEIDHIIPESLGGLAVEENLWLACSMCNDHKGNRIADPDHFGWSMEGDMIIGKTSIGRATIAAVRLNRVDLVEARRGWVSAGWHPPKD